MTRAAILSFEAASMNVIVVTSLLIFQLILLQFFLRIGHNFGGTELRAISLGNTMIFAGPWTKG